MGNHNNLLRAKLQLVAIFGDNTKYDHWVLVIDTVLGILGVFYNIYLSHKTIYLHLGHKSHMNLVFS